eukprot:TRINITY_DN4061_c1_g1_i3.p1 TRINITY_DN4061_c1_g1~~TRINITY_DN4061_c1_g1_i3.p1  ORF type:complete len:345 (+),score=49.22 TRINITY_DN4061_c1_g1_i3:434-1468(+)
MYSGCSDLLCVSVAGVHYGTQSLLLGLGVFVALIPILYIFLRHYLKAQTHPSPLYGRSGKHPKDTVVMVTGAASGMGKHFVVQCLERGYNVVAMDVQEERLDEAFGEGGIHTPSDAQMKAGRVLPVKLDVVSRQNWEDAVEQARAMFGGEIDVLVNFAGVLFPKYLMDISVADVDKTFDINVKGTVHGTHVLARQMASQRLGGHIVNVASVAGLTPVQGIGLYSASKFAVRAFSMIAAREMRPKNVYVSVLCPGPVQRPMLDMQTSHKEAALTFSSDSITVDDISRCLFDHVLPQRPVEVWLPNSVCAQACVANVMYDNRFVEKGEEYMRGLGLANITKTRAKE